MNEIDLRWVMIDDWIFSLSLSLEWDDYEDVMSEWIYSNIWMKNWKFRGGGRHLASFNTVDMFECTRISKNTHSPAA